jgi:glycosyltransferase involved in cell wall biosynthesis
MRITIILGPFYPVPTVLGGAVEKVHLTLAAEYARAGHHVTMISRRFDAFPAEETIAGVHHMRIASYDRRPSLGVNLFLSFLYALRAARAMPISDITVTNSTFLPLILPKRKAGKIYDHVARYPKGQFFLYRRADRFQAVSTVVADAIRIQTPGRAADVVVIANPISEKYFSSTSREAKAPTVLFVGRLAREKGVGNLIRAFSNLMSEGGPDWKLRIVGPHAFEQGGDGAPFLNELKELAAPLGSRCEFVGPIFDEDRLIREYASASIFVYPSVAERGEAFGLAPLEAMAAGCTTVVSDLRCFDDFVVDGENALKFDHRRPEPQKQLEAALARLINDQSLAGRLAVAGTATAQKFRTSVIAGKMLGDFQALLDPRMAA